MKRLLDELETLKKSHNIQSYHFEESDVYVKDRFREGKVLTLETINTAAPSKFPSSDVDRGLLREMGLNLMGWRVSNFDVHSHRYIFEIYKLSQTERFLHHCKNRTCVKIDDDQCGTIKLFFTRRRVQIGLDKYERRVLLRLSYITKADADYWDLGASIKIEAHNPKPVEDKTRHWIQDVKKLSKGQMENVLDNYFHGKPELWQTCPDCKDGFYYPLIGKREPCETCIRSRQ